MPAMPARTASRSTFDRTFSSASRRDQAKSITQNFAGIDDGNRLEAERRALLRETREIDAMVVYFSSALQSFP